MRGKLKNEGEYELFKTTEGHQILNIKDKDFYALVEGQEGDIIVHSDSEHKKDKTISKGKYYFAEFEDDPEFQDMPHLFLEDGKKYRELILPNGLPTKSDHQKKLVHTSKKLPASKVEEHIKGKGNQGSEKQYEGKKEGLRKKTKEELYEMAKQKKISGRSKMKKKDLVQALEEGGK